MAITTTELEVYSGNAVGTLVGTKITKSGSPPDEPIAPSEALSRIEIEAFSPGRASPPDTETPGIIPASVDESEPVVISFTSSTFTVATEPVKWAFFIEP